MIATYLIAVVGCFPDFSACWQTFNVLFSPILEKTNMVSSFRFGLVAPVSDSLQPHQSTQSLEKGGAAGAQEVLTQNIFCDLFIY